MELPPNDLPSSDQGVFGHNSIFLVILYLTTGRVGRATFKLIFDPLLIGIVDIAYTKIKLHKTVAIARKFHSPLATKVPHSATMLDALICFLVAFIRKADPKKKWRPNLIVDMILISITYIALIHKQTTENDGDELEK